MTPREFLDLVVTPNLSELYEDFGNMCCGFNAIHSVDALAARIFHAVPSGALGGDDTEYRENLARISHDFRLLRDLAKAVKHVSLERGQPTIQRANQMEPRVLGVGQLLAGDARVGPYAPLTVVNDAGELLYVATIVRNGCEVLKAEMARLKL